MEIGRRLAGAAQRELGQVDADAALEGPRAGQLFVEGERSGGAVEQPAAGGGEPAPQPFPVAAQIAGRDRD